MSAQGKRNGEAVKRRRRTKNRVKAKFSTRQGEPVGDLGARPGRDRSQWLGRETGHNERSGEDRTDVVRKVSRG